MIRSYNYGPWFGGRARQTAFLSANRPFVRPDQIYKFYQQSPGRRDSVRRSCRNYRSSTLYTIQHDSAVLQIDSLASSTCPLQWDLAKPRNCWQIILAPLNYTVKGGTDEATISFKGLVGAVEYRNALTCLSHNFVRRIIHKFFVSVTVISRTVH